jgi:putative phosphotransacetylase
MGNERGALLDQVKIRVDKSFTTEMHIDTDEANACQVKQGDMAAIIF